MPVTVPRARDCQDQLVDLQVERGFAPALLVQNHLGEDEAADRDHRRQQVEATAVEEPRAACD